MGHCQVHFESVTPLDGLSRDARCLARDLGQRWGGITHCDVTFEQPGPVGTPLQDEFIARIHVRMDNGYEVITQQFASTALGLKQALRNAFGACEARIDSLKSEMAPAAHLEGFGARAALRGLQRERGKQSAVPVGVLNKTSFG